ncbi:MAG: hypothetical protein OXG85_12735 [Chloroflexi bacterium]|nr:hypothetical protein [Chloroflexota bacterium]
MPLFRACRNHIHFFIIMPLLIIVMTWPAITHGFDANIIALPTRNFDVFQKLWDVWHLEQFLAGRASFFHTDAMFYPLGVSLAFENFSLPHMLSVSLLRTVLPTTQAYTLTYLLIVFTVALSAYLYLNYLLRDRWLATFGAIVFGLSQHVITHAAQPDVNFIISLPLTAYFFQRALHEGRRKHLVFCGFTVGFTAYMSVYIFICVLITLALMILGYAVGRWRERRFWRWMLSLGLIIGLLSAARLAPMLADAGELETALDKTNATEYGTDLLSYFINHRHPLTTPILKSLFQADSTLYAPRASYLGYLPLALIFIGLSRADCRREMLPWLALALPFLLLRLGSVLTIDGQDYANIVLPKSLLNDLLPAIFQPFHTPNHFHMGFLLPFAVLTCYGLKAILRLRPRKQRRLITLALIALVSFEYYETAAPRIIPERQLDFIEWLRRESAEVTPRLINLPMGRQHAKYYGYYQTLTGFPQVEGLSGRTPPTAYRYIKSNLLLEAWNRGVGVHCFPPLRAEYIAALDALRSDGFTHVIWHHELFYWRAPRIATSFIDAPASYSDDFVDIYHLDDLRQSCDQSTLVYPQAREELQGLKTSPAIIPESGSAILSIRAGDDAAQAPGELGAAALFDLHEFSSLALRDGAIMARNERGEVVAGIDQLLADLSVILLVYDPRTANPASVRAYRAWLASNFDSCQRLTETDETVIEYFLRSAFPCQLAIAAEPQAVLYANGAQLGNLQVDFDGGNLDIYLLWTRLPVEPHAVSFQLFDADGAKAMGKDFVIGQEPLARYRIDASSLPPGDYQVKMIVYNYETGASVAGALSAGGASFERELALGPLTKS